MLTVHDWSLKKLLKKNRNYRGFLICNDDRVTKIIFPTICNYVEKTAKLKG